MTQYTNNILFLYTLIYTLHTVMYVQKWNVIKKLNSKACILVVLFCVVHNNLSLLPCLITQYGKISMYWCCIHRCNVIQFYIQGSIRWRSYVIIRFVAPAIGPNKSKKLTRLISPTHNIRGKV